MSDNELSASDNGLSERLAEAGRRLAAVGGEIRAMRDTFEDLASRMEALDQQFMDPQTVRRATLNQVWDALIDDGNMSGARLVMKMRDRHSDWSSPEAEDD